MANYDWVPKELEGRFTHINGKLVASCEVCGATKGTPGKKYVLEQIAKGQAKKYRFCSVHGNFRFAKPSKEDIESWPAGHKRCRRCLEVKPFSEFHAHKDCLFGVSVECKECRRPSSKKSYEGTSLEYRMWNSSRHRAKKVGIQHNLRVSDIVIPEICPVLGVPLVPNTRYAPSLDRINPEKGYVVGNVRVISKRANTLKNNMSVDECEAVLLDLKSILNNK